MPHNKALQPDDPKLASLTLAAERSVTSFRRIPYLFFAIAFWISSTIASELPDYEGRWKYDVEKSSAYIMSAERIPQVFRDIVSKEGSYYPDSFSLLFTFDSFGTSHIFKEASEIELFRFDIIEHTASHFKIRIIEPGIYQGSELTAYFENNCIYYFETEWKIKSYFCKKNKNS